MEMKVAIISDTHARKHFDKIQSFINTMLSDVDLIVHAGDYTNVKLVNILKQSKPFVGVWGNNDGDDIRAILKEKEITKLGRYKIGIFHGHGKEKTTPDRAFDMFKGDDVDIIIFGHSHKPLVQTQNNVLMLNPGSMSSKRHEKFFSYIILNLEDDEISVELKFFDNRVGGE
jgi:putative phosphoesterase